MKLNKVIFVLALFVSTIFAEEYIVMFQVKEKSFTLDLMKHARNDANKVEFEVSVSKEYYNSVFVGKPLVSKFRTSSAVMNGSFGSSTVTVVGKRISK
jgi:hypothetical protein